MSRYTSKAERSRWAVMRERLQIQDERPPPPERMKSVGDITSSVMKRLGLDQPLWEQALLDEWPALVGEQVARHTRPGKLEYGILHVYVANSAWLFELRQQNEKLMLDRLQKRFDARTIRGLRLQLDPDRR